MAQGLVTYDLRGFPEDVISLIFDDFSGAFLRGTAYAGWRHTALESHTLDMRHASHDAAPHRWVGFDQLISRLPGLLGATASCTAVSLEPSID